MKPCRGCTSSFKEAREPNDKTTDDRLRLVLSDLADCSYDPMGPVWAMRDETDGPV